MQSDPNRNRQGCNCKKATCRSCNNNAGRGATGATGATGPVGPTGGGAGANGPLKFSGLVSANNPVAYLADSANSNLSSAAPIGYPFAQPHTISGISANYSGPALAPGQSITVTVTQNGADIVSPFAYTVTLDSTTGGPGVPVGTVLPTATFTPNQTMDVRVNSVGLPTSPAYQISVMLG